jgi:hypothetical protein
MKRYLSLVAMAGLLFAGVAGAADTQKAAKASLDDRIHDFDVRTSKSDAVMRDALHAVSVETGVPETKIQDMHHKHPQAGAAHILLSCVMADKTKRDPDYYLTQKGKDKTWAKMAKEENVPIDELDSRFARLEKHMDYSVADTEKRAKQQNKEKHKKQ